MLFKNSKNLQWKKSYYNIYIIYIILLYNYYIII